MAPPARLILFPALVVALFAIWPTGVNADGLKSRHSRIRGEFQEGAREIRRDRREAFVEILRSDSPRIVLGELWEGAREVRRLRW
ncbi:MAG: hypothetical protein VKP70_00550 [Cyanobacteriota bacterium]|nr:hypothetical protein [Cyanobacteriota bacterium]